MVHGPNMERAQRGTTAKPKQRHLTAETQRIRRKASKQLVKNKSGFFVFCHLRRPNWLLVAEKAEAAEEVI